MTQKEMNRYLVKRDNPSDIYHWTQLLSLRDDMVEIPAEKAERIISARNKKHDDKVEAVALAPQPEEITPRVARIVDQINAWGSPSKPCIFSLSKIFGYKKANGITKKERDQAWEIYQKQKKISETTASSGE